jgi:hypothetical protein
MGNSFWELKLRNSNKTKVYEKKQTLISLRTEHWSTNVQLIQRMIGQEDQMGWVKP